jgi:cupin 2 domain-containing protein
MTDVRNILSNVPAAVPDEVFERIVDAEGVRVERIVSRGQSSPPGFWYDQDRNEWVLLLKGSARLLFEGDDAAVELKPGDYVNIPAHRRHRVEWTDPNEPTVWLAVHY